ncbi:hypothetical protein SAMN02745126_02832 [Enhydrobacter aerosaccus]|uniref:CHAP domain-containing protein n=1 Tax=Enhydrobacter aerosaccus TaxID=225324 RepID=A0A1T4PHK6_9HYPH|nr:hypothetical protein [Enhydrobacter aerosaccus]SJZ91014.1 hypothetical protein SAMN02745126_02832 [Enhydrobacter aerosaccus]
MSSMPRRLRPSRRLLLSGIPATLLASLLVSTPGFAQSCCGPITPNGKRLLQRLDASGVDHLWLPYKPVEWETGELDPNPYAKPAATHCSAFVAAFGKQLGVYILRPPEHSPTLLANAQMRWLLTDGPSSGWRPLADAAAAQQSANLGNLVVAAYENPDPHKAGHIAFIRPGVPTAARLASEGPDVTQAGASNALSMPLKRAFSHHRGAWPDEIRYYEHPIAWPS